MIHIQRPARHLRWVAVVFASALAVVLFGTVSASASQSSRALGQADLVVSSTDFLRVIHDESGFSAYLATIANPGAQFVTPGKGAFLAAAGPSTTKFTFLPVTQLNINGQIQIVPDLVGRPIVIKTATTPTIPRGGSAVVGAFFNRGESLPWGRYRVTVCSDSAQVVAEINETNNCKTVTTTL